MEKTGQTRTTGLRERYRRVIDAVHETAQRHGAGPHNVIMVAVTDRASPDQIRQIVQLGQTDLGETNVQQLPHRAGQLAEFLTRQRFLTRGRDGADGHHAPAEAGHRVRWHILGSIGRAQIRAVLPLAKLVHCVDSLRIAEDLHAFAARQDAIDADGRRPTNLQQIELLLQVNTSNNPARPGVAPAAAVHLAEQIDSMVNLRLRGLSTEVTAADDAEQARGAFARCAEIFHEIAQSRVAGPAFNILAMGNSDTYEAAIEEGANIVRVGRAIFDGD